METNLRSISAVIQEIPARNPERLHWTRDPFEARWAARFMSISAMRLMVVAVEKSSGKDQNPAETIRPAERPEEMGQNKVKFEIFGEEMLEKEVKPSGNSGRVYLPPDWVGHRVKIIRID